MTISTSSSFQTVAGNGSTSVFTFSFIGDSTSFLSVVYTDATGATTTLSPSQYTITLNAPAVGAIWGIGGVLTYPLSGTPIASGTYLTISRVLPLTQTTTITNQGAFSPQVIEAALDTLEMQIQQVDGAIVRSVTVPTSVSSAPVLEPPYTSGYFLAYDSNGNIVAAAGTGGGNVSTTGTPTTGAITLFSAASTITSGNLSGDVTTANTLVTTISANAVTTSKITNNAVTQAKMATGTANRLTGYDNSGNFSTVAIGSGLSLSGGTLSNTGGGGGGVSSVTPGDSSLIISPTTGAVIAALNVGNTNTWTASQTFTNAGGTLVTLNNPNLSTSTRAQGWYLDTTNPGTGLAIKGRIQVGESTLNVFSQTAGTGSEWVEALSNATTRLAQLSSVNWDSGIGVLGASRTSDVSAASSQGTQALTGIVNNDNTSTVMTSYGLYLESWKQSTTASDGIAQGGEIAVINLFASTSSQLNTNPYNTNPNGLIEGFRIGSGKPSQGGQVVSTALSIVNAEATGSAKFRRGINIGSDAISAGGDGNLLAFNMAQGHCVAWWVDASNIGPFIRSDVATAGDGLRQIFGDNTWNIQEPGSSTNLLTLTRSGTTGSLALNSVTLDPNAMTYKGALVIRSTNFSVADSTATDVQWSSATSDTSSIWSGGNPTRLTVPAGVSIVEIHAGIQWDNNATGYRILNIRKNAAAFPGQPQTTSVPVTGIATTMNVSSGPLTVSPGDYFEVRVTQTSGGALNVSGAASALSWMSMRILK